MMYQFSEEMTRKMKLFYQEEYAKTLQRANELKTILDQMEEVDVDITTVSIKVEKKEVASKKAKQPDTATSLETTAPVNKTKKTVKKRKKNNIRSEWLNFILSRLKATQKPLSYDDMAHHAISSKKLDKTSFNDVRKSLMGAAFALRTRYEKIDTYAVKGSRTKYLGLNSWFEREGLLKKEFREKI